MRFDEYFFSLTQDEKESFVHRLCLLVRKSSHTVWTYAYKTNGQSLIVPPNLCNIIYVLSNGNVTPHEIRPDCFTKGQLPQFSAKEIKKILSAGK